MSSVLPDEAATVPVDDIRPAAVAGPVPGPVAGPVAMTEPIDTTGRTGRGGWRLGLRRHGVTLALVLIVLGGAAVRLVGIKWGLPLQLHPDEWVIVDGALDMARRHSFEPPFYYRPDHVEMQLANLAYLAYSYLLHHASPAELYAADQAPFFLIARLITACWGIGMIVLGYLIGARFTRVIGLLTALLIAFFPPFVLHSHYATPDVPLTVAFMLVILGCMRYLSEPTWRRILLPSLGVSIAFAIKYPGALGTLMIALTVVVSAVQHRAWRRIVTHGAIAIGAVIGFLFAVSPVLFTNGAVVLANITGEAAGADFPGASNLGWAGKVGFYATNFATAGGLALVVFFLLGIWWTVRLRLGQSVPLWMGAIVWLLLSVVPLHWDRWGLPMYLTPLLIAPIGIYYSARFLLERGPARWIRWAAGAIAVVMVANLVLGSVAVSAQLVAKNTQVYGLADFAARGVTTGNAVYEGYTPLHPGNPRFLFDQFLVVDGRLMLNPADPDRARLRYVVVSSDLYGRYFTDPKYAQQQQFYRMLDEQYPLVTAIRPVPWGAPTVFALAGIWRSIGDVAGVLRGGLSGPTVKLYEIPADRR